MAVLKFFIGDKALFRHRLKPSRTIIGRLDRCDIALPSDEISRTHCFIEHRSDGWWLTDRSRHGTVIGGKTISRHQLKDGDQISLGGYTAIFETTPLSRAAGTTATIVRPFHDEHEEIVELGEGVVTTNRVVLRVSTGPKEGQEFELLKPKLTLGGDGADLMLDRDLPECAVTLRVVRGRLMVAPSAMPIFLAGARIRMITPALAGEELTVGPHRLVVESRTADVEPSPVSCFGGAIGGTRVMQSLFGVLKRMAQHEAPVLLMGESGTGKELAARGLHEHGVRRGAPFVALNCAAVSDNLFESELFGHLKGSFTGAVANKGGAFQAADGGTLFLDEIGELRIASQAKLLRTLESGEVRRVGSSKSEYPDVRVVAATNRDLSAMVMNGEFRADLYFRLSVLSVEMPPLRKRKSDIAMLADAILKKQFPGVTIDDSARQKLLTHRWPGNVRELRNVLTRAIVLHGNVITPESLQFDHMSFATRPRRSPRKPSDEERTQIAEALTRNDGNRTHTARALGIPRSSLIYKIKRYGL